MSHMEIATLAGGCFWCLEAVYLDLEGVTKVESGYMGGQVDNPPTNRSAEAAPATLKSFKLRSIPRSQPSANMLEVFFTIHDPTTLNRQGTMSARSTDPRSSTIPTNNAKAAEESDAGNPQSEKSWTTHS